MKKKIKVNEKMKLFKQKQSAQSLVEFAISLMIILMLLLGAVEISLALFQYVTIRDAAQEGAIFGSSNPSDEAGIQYRVVAAASDVVTIDPTTVVVTITGAECEGSTGGNPNMITVTVPYEHKIIFPLVTPMIGTDTITLTGTVNNTILSPRCE